MSRHLVLRQPRRARSGSQPGVAGLVVAAWLATPIAVVATEHPPAALPPAAAPELLATVGPATLILLEPAPAADLEHPADPEALIELGGQFRDAAEQAAPAEAAPPEENGRTSPNPPDPFADPAQPMGPPAAETTEATPETAGVEVDDSLATQDDAPLQQADTPAPEAGGPLAGDTADPAPERRAADDAAAEAGPPVPPAHPLVEAEASSEAAAGANPPIHRPLMPPSRPAWTELDAGQQKILGPFEPEWQAWPESEKRRWLALANRVPRLSPAEQARAAARIGEWALLTPEQRQIVLHNYRLARKLPPDERRAHWERYNEMTAEQRQALRASQDWTRNTAARHAGALSGLATEAAQPLAPGRLRGEAPR